MQKICPICGKKGLLKLSNHLAIIHKLSSEERQSYLIRAKRMPVDITTVLTELRKLNKLIENASVFIFIMYSIQLRHPFELLVVQYPIPS